MVAFAVWVALVLALAGGKPPSPLATGWALAGDGCQASTERVVYLAGQTSPESLVSFTCAAARGPANAVVLIDSPKARTANKAFLDAYRPTKIVAAGTFPDGIAELEKRLDREAVMPGWSRHPSREQWLALFPRAKTVVVCPAEPRVRFLQAACLAGTEKAPLVIWDGEPGEAEEFAELLNDWKPHQVYAIGDAADACRQLTSSPIVDLTDEQAVAARHVKELALSAPVQSLVVANPDDLGEGQMSSLAPWIAVRHRAALLLTNDKGDNVESVVKTALEKENLRHADNLIFVANLKAIPMQRRPNPIPDDKDPYIEMEPLTPTGFEPFTFATGRLFHEDPAVVLLMLARQRLLADKQGSRKAYLASNSGNSMPLLETFSRNTAKELRNAGYETTATFGKDVNRYELRKALTDHDIFVWEGHHNTLIKDYAMPEWDDSLPPCLVFLQSCLALTEEKTHPLLTHGAVGVVGSSSRVYSASGGAYSLAYFDALLYDHESLGGSLRQAKNFLLAYAQLKEKRLGNQAKRGGANMRSAWSFTLWGDPTLSLPQPDKLEKALTPVRHEVRGDTIVVTVPLTNYEKVSTHKYQVQIPPNAHLAGLVHPDEYEDGKPLVPFLFAEVRLPNAPSGKTPRLQGRLPSSHYVFCWDERRSTGYLLIEPRATDPHELRFRLQWEPVTPEPVTDAERSSASK
jgi:hypothetical protein